MALLLVIWVTTWFREPGVCLRNSFAVSARAGQYWIKTNGRLEFDVESIDYQLPWTHRAKLTSTMLVTWDEHPPFIPFSLWQRMHVGRWWIDVIQVGAPWAPEFYIFIPFWIPLAAFAAPSAIAWWALLRRARPGQCHQCRYDRHGLAVGVACPECGTTPR